MILCRPSVRVFLRLSVRDVVFAISIACIDGFVDQILTIVHLGTKVN